MITYGGESGRKGDGSEGGTIAKHATTEGGNSLWDYNGSKGRAVTKTIIVKGGKSGRKGDGSEGRATIKAALLEGGNTFRNFVNALNLIFSITY